MDEEQREGGQSPEFKELEPGTSLNEVFNFAEGLTRERNRKYISTLSDRLAHLTRGVGEVANADRAGDMKIIPVIASKLVLRIFAVLETLGARDEFVEVLMHKYPEAGCSYCGFKPCRCNLDRAPGAVGAKPSEAQREWSLKEWQGNMKEVYGARNDELSIQSIILRLVEELGEVAQAALLFNADDAEKRFEEYRNRMISELTDCFAWLIALCNHREVGADLETAFVGRYGKGCPNCGKYPCRCEAFTYVDERKDPRNK